MQAHGTDGQLGMHVKHEDANRGNKLLDFGSGKAADAGSQPLTVCSYE